MVDDATKQWEQISTAANRIFQVAEQEGGHRSQSMGKPRTLVKLRPLVNTDQHDQDYLQHIIEHPRDLGVRLGGKDTLPAYLDLALDPWLNLTSHVAWLANSERERVGIMRKLVGTNWGATLSSLKTMYITLVRSILEYGKPVLNLAIKQVSKTSIESRMQPCG